MFGVDDAILIGLALAGSAGGISSSLSGGKDSKKAKRYAKAQAAAELAAQKRRDDALNELITQAEVPTEHQRSYKVSLGALSRSYGDRRAEIDRQEALHPGESGTIAASRDNLDLAETRDQANLFGAADEQRNNRVALLKSKLGEYNSTALGDLSRFYERSAERSDQSGNSALSGVGSTLGNLAMLKAFGGSGGAVAAGGTGGTTGLLGQAKLGLSPFSLGKYANARSIAARAAIGG